MKVGLDASVDVKAPPEGVRKNAHFVYATVGEARRISIELPADFPEGTSVEVIVLAEFVTTSHQTQFTKGIAKLAR